MVGAIEVHGEIALGETGFLARLDPAVAAVREHDEGDGKFVAHHRLELAAGEAEAAVAHDGDAFRARPAELGANRAGQRVSERAMCAIRDEMAPGEPGDVE